VYANDPDADRAVMEKIRGMVTAELVSADRGHRATRGTPIDLVALVALADWPSAARLLDDNPALIEPESGVLHLLAQRGDVAAVRWLLARGANVNGRWSSHGAEVTPLHLAASRGHADMVRLLLDAGVDRSVRDSMYDSDARGWAEHFKQPAIVQLLDFA
jgi:hypothetical protein